MASHTNNGSRDKVVVNVNASLVGVEGFLCDMDMDTLGMDYPNMSVATKELVAMTRELKTNLFQMQVKVKEGEANLTHFEDIELRVEKGQTISVSQISRSIGSAAIEEA
eukprot:12281847-Ditylum_brightwellii.AAC.1